jgi:hypothetical protein
VLGDGLGEVLGDGLGDGLLTAGLGEAGVDAAHCTLAAQSQT